MQRKIRQNEFSAASMMDMKTFVEVSCSLSDGDSVTIMSDFECSWGNG